MRDLRSAKLLALGALAVLLVVTANFSTAAFTNSSENTARVSAAADWTPPTVELRSPTSYLTGTASLTASASDGESAIARVTVERRRSGTDAWTTICSDGRSSYTCTWNTMLLADGGYDVRASATDAAGYTGHSTLGVTVDNTAPTVTMADPGSPLSGARAFSAAPSDATSGVARVDIQYTATGRVAWTTLCTASAEPWSCEADTKALPYGAYDFRAVAADAAGNTATSAPVLDRLVDNTVAGVSLQSPPSLLTGVVRLDATASSSAGVVLVRLQYAPTGSGTWTDICTVTTAPYTCSWDTSRLADGSYDLRAQMLDGTGRFTSSTVVGARTVVNTAPTTQGAPDVQTSNGGSTAGLMEANDTITFTYSCQVDLRTVRTAWAGGPAPVVLRLRDVADTETIEVVGTNLGVVNLNGNYSKKDRVLDVDATMTAGSVTVGGQPRTTVTVTLGQLPSASNGTLETVTTPTTLVWTPSGAVRNLAGQPCTSTRVTESGAADVDF